MKLLFYAFAFMFIGFETQAQVVPDTLYTKYGTMSADKKMVVTKTTEIGGKKIQEIEVFDSLKVKVAIENLTRDTAQYNQYFNMLNNQQDQIVNEKIRIRKLYREAIRQLSKYYEIRQSMRK